MCEVRAPSVTRQLDGRHGAGVRPGEPDGHPAGRTASEQEVAAEGLPDAEITDRLVIGHETVTTYVSRILTELDLGDRVQAVVLTYRTGLASSHLPRLTSSRRETTYG